MRFFLITILLLIISCTPKNVQLPKVDDAPITHVIDHSAVYIFFDEKNNHSQLNRNNLITSTHWIFHIDRRNSFKEVAQHIDFMQTKKENPMNPHNNPNSQNYFSVADTISQKLGFINFTKTRFSAFSSVQIDDNPEVIPIFVENENFRIQGEKILLSELFLDENKTYLWVFDNEISFQDFIRIYTHLLKRNYVPKTILYKK